MGQEEGRNDVTKRIETCPNSFQSVQGYRVSDNLTNPHEPYVGGRGLTAQVPSHAQVVSGGNRLPSSV